MNTVSELYDRLTADTPVLDLLLLDYHLNPSSFTAPDVLKWLKEQVHLQEWVANVWSALNIGPQAKSCPAIGVRRFFST